MNKFLSSPAPCLLSLIGVLNLGLSAARGDTVFQQNFDGPGPYATTTNPDPTQFDSFNSGGSGFAISVVPSGGGNALQGVRSGSSSGSAVRSTNLATAGLAARFQFNFKMSAIDASSAPGTPDIDFQVGSGYGATSTGAEASVTFGQFFFDLQSTTKYGIYLSTSQGGSAALLDVGTTYPVSFYVNRMATPVSFTAPDGSSQTLSAASVTLYVGNTLYVNNFAAAATNPNQPTTNDITDFKLRFATDLGAFVADDFLVTTIPEPGSWAWTAFGFTAIAGAAIYRRHANLG